MHQLESDWLCKFIIFESLQQLDAHISSSDICPDVTISDYRLAHGVSGVDVVNRIKAHYGMDAPAILISGDTDSSLLSEIEQSDIFMLHKPIEAQRLKTVLATLADQ